MSPRPYVDWLAVLDRIEGGEPAAFAELTQLIVGWLRRYRAQLEPSASDDLIQNVTVVVLDHHRSGRLRAPEAFVSFVGGVVRNCLRSWTRQQAKLVRGGLGDGEAGLEARLRADERRDADPQVLTDLSKALASLPDRHRAVVEALYVRGETYEEAASALGLAFGTLKRLQRQGLAALREGMGVGDEEPQP